MLNEKQKQKILEDFEKSEKAGLERLETECYMEGLTKSIELLDYIKYFNEIITHWENYPEYQKYDLDSIKNTYEKMKNDLLLKLDIRKN